MNDKYKNYYRLIRLQMDYKKPHRYGFAVPPEQKTPTGEQPVPREVSSAGIEDIIPDFGESARRAIEAGFVGIEIHGANGYLIQQFFTPQSNQREDQWGEVWKKAGFPDGSHRLRKL